MGKLKWAKGQLEEAKKLKEMGTYQESIDVLKEIMSVFEEVEAWELYVEGMNLWSEGLWRNGKYDEGIEKTSIALEKTKDVLNENHPHFAYIYNNLGVCYYLKDNCSLAIEFFQKNLDICLEGLGEKHPDTAASYNNLGVCYRSKGEYKKNIEYHQKALLIRLGSLGENHADTAASYDNLGVCHSDKGNYDRAIEYHQKALHICLKNLGEKHPSVAFIYNNMGVCLYAKGNYYRAFKYHQKALHIRLESLGAKHADTAVSYNNLGNCYYSKDKYKKAFKCHQKALHIRLECLGEEHAHTAFSYGNLGNCYYAKGKYKRAIKCLQKSIDICLESLGDKHPITAANYFSLGVCLQDKAEHDSAIQYFQKAFQSNLYAYNIENSYHNPQLQNYAEYEVLTNVFTNKTTSLQHIYQQSHSPQYLFTALFTSQVALKWIDHIRQSFYNDGSKLTLAQKSYDIYKNGTKVAHHSARVAAQDPEAWEQAINKIADINHDSWPRDTLNYCFTSDNCLHTAFDICEKSRAMVLLGNLKDEEAKGQSLIPAYLLQKEYDLKVELNYYDKKIKQEEYKPVQSDSEGNEGRDETKLREWQSTFFDYKQEYDALIEQLETDYPDYYALKYEVETVGVEQLQETLNEVRRFDRFSKSVKSEYQTIIQYFIGDEHLYLFAITATEYHALEIAKPADFEEDVKDFLHSIEQKDKSEYVELAHQLYQVLLAPIFKKISFSEKNSHLIIIPDGILAQLPFESLLTQNVSSSTAYKDLPYLLNDYEVSYHFSATLWHRSQQKKALETASLGEGFIGFAPVYLLKAQRVKIEEQDTEMTSQATPDISEEVPSYATRNIQIGDTQYPALLASEREVKSIAQLFKNASQKSESYLHEAATTQNFLKKVPAYKYILVAAHADYQVERPDLTGIVFSPEAGRSVHEEDEFGIRKTYQDHILYMSDAYHLALQNADLVVLSCCETGVGKVEKGEGVMALHRGFLFAGARNIIYTLCKVSDEQSSELTQALFRHILQGKPYRTALRQAKLDLIRLGNVPVYWSGYVLVGE